MSMSMYQASVPVFRRMLVNLSAILAKGAAAAEERGYDPAALMDARLAPDMFALSRQVQIATDGAKGCAARLSGREIPSFPDTETTFAELKTRIEKTIAFLDGVPAGEIDGSEEKAITLKLRSREVTFSGQDYLLNFVLPNFFFHVTTSYAILRHNGVQLGKMDFLGGV